MQLTVTITDKLIKQAIENALDNEVYEYWDSATLKAAKIPKTATMVKEIFADPKFQAQLTKELTSTAESALEDYIFEVLDEIRIPQIDTLCKKVQEAEEAMGAVELARQEDEEVKRMVKTLERAGFKIVKT